MIYIQLFTETKKHIFGLTHTKAVSAEIHILHDAKPGYKRYVRRTNGEWSIVDNDGTLIFKESADSDQTKMLSVNSKTPIGTKATIKEIENACFYARAHGHDVYCNSKASILALMAGSKEADWIDNFATSIPELEKQSCVALGMKELTRTFKFKTGAYVLLFPVDRWSKDGVKAMIKDESLTEEQKKRNPHYIPGQKNGQVIFVEKHMAEPVYGHKLPVNGLVRCLTLIDMIPE